MDDLISRQAVMNCFHDWIDKRGDIHTPDEMAEYRAIEALPSVQPEIIRCKDCKYQSKGQNECETWNLCGYRPWQYTPTTDEHFCSYAERRKDV